MGEFVCDGGVGRFFGEAAETWDCMGGGSWEKLGSSLGAMFEFDLRGWCLFIIVLGIGGGWESFEGKSVGPRLGLPVFARNSDWTSIP